MKRFLSMLTLGALLSLTKEDTYGQDSSVFIPQHFLSLRHDNDYLNLALQGTDKYYTAGIYLQYSFISPAHKNILNKILYSPDHSDPSFLTVGVTQWMYTPDKVQYKTAVLGDYPFCGALFLDLSRENILSGKQLFRSELWLGMIGPAALADQAQKLVHKVISSIEPDGWNNQIPDYPVINYNLYYEPNLFSFSRIFKVNGIAAIQAGTLMNTASAGLDFLISNQRDNYFPDRIYNQPREKARKTRLYLQFIPVVKFVATNSILQGGPFDRRDFYHISQGDLERVIFQGTGVMGIRMRKFSIQYQQVFETSEFKTVPYHIYGSFALTLGF
jgi:lipid A 3-O-deacylase